MKDRKRSNVLQEKQSLFWKRERNFFTGNCRKRQSSFLR